MPEIIAPGVKPKSTLEKCAEEINAVLAKHKCQIKPLIRYNETGILPDIVIYETETKENLETAKPESTAKPAIAK